jgi:hypothetical protein
MMSAVFGEADNAAGSKFFECNYEKRTSSIQNGRPVMLCCQLPREFSLRTPSCSDAVPGDFLDGTLFADIHDAVQVSVQIWSINSNVPPY